jgi:hypothetical protein
MSEPRELLVRIFRPTIMQTSPRIATLEPVRFGEFLLARNQITDEQRLAALADHWSDAAFGHHRRLGATIIDHGFLPPEALEAEARAFHDEIDVVEITDSVPRTERVTVPMPVTEDL